MIIRFDGGYQASERASRGGDRRRRRGHCSRLPLIAGTVIEPMAAVVAGP